MISTYEHLLENLRVEIRFILSSAGAKPSSYAEGAAELKERRNFLTLMYFYLLRRAKFVSMSSVVVNS